jgi:hypothetical protein
MGGDHVSGEFYEHPGWMGMSTGDDQPAGVPTEVEAPLQAAAKDLAEYEYRVRELVSSPMWQDTVLGRALAAIMTEYDQMRAERTRMLVEKDQWHDSARIAEAQLAAQKPIVAAAVKLAQRWVEWDGTENMVPWIRAVASAVTAAVENARGESSGR